MFTEVFPIVATADVTRALRFYRDALGGRVTHEFHDPDGACVYVGIDIGTSHMGISLVRGNEPQARQGGRVWVYAEDCDVATERLRSAGYRVVEEPAARPAGERVARVQDADGNDIFVGQRGSGSGDDANGGDSLGLRLLSPEPERYTRPEFERRFLVAPGSRWKDQVEPYTKAFDDLYIRHSHLRLRTLSDSATGREFIKLTKKLESSSPYVQLVGSIPLSPMEYEFIARLEGARIRKVRHYHLSGDHVFSIDVFQEELNGLVLCEVEAESLDALMRIDLPGYCAVEVTEDPFFTGGNLSRTTREELALRLREMGTEP